MTPSAYGYARLIEPSLVTAEEVYGWVQHLPDYNFLRVYMDHARTQTPADLVVHAVNGLTLCAASAPPTLVATRGRGLIANTYAPLYGWVVGATGTWKTQSQTVATSLLRQSALVKLMAPRPSSAEVLHKGLMEQPHGVLTYPEFLTFLASTSGTDGMGSRLRGALIDAFDCDSYETSGLRSGKFTVTEPRLSVFAACAPTHVATHTMQDDFSGGFVNRFLLAYARAPEHTAAWQRADDDARRQWLLEWLNTSLDRPIGVCHGMDNAAHAMWLEWYEDWKKFEATLTTTERDTMARTPMIATRVALVAAWASTTPCQAAWYLGPEHILAGLGAAAIHVASCRLLLSVVPRTQERREINAVLDAIRYDWTPLGEITRVSQLGKRKVAQHIETLEGEMVVVKDSQNGNPFYRRVDGIPVPYDRNLVHLPPPP